MTGSVLVVALVFFPHVRMRVSSTSRCQVGLECHHHHGREHGYEARQGLIALAEEVRETWVGEGLEGGREEVDECGGDQDAGAEVLGVEDDAIRASVTGVAG